jgi:hypothetical protein
MIGDSGRAEVAVIGGNRRAARVGGCAPRVAVAPLAELRRGLRNVDA